MMVAVNFMGGGGGGRETRVIEQRNAESGKFVYRGMYEEANMTVVG